MNKRRSNILFSVIIALFATVAFNACSNGGDADKKVAPIEARSYFLGSYTGTMATTSDPVPENLEITAVSDSITAIGLAFKGLNLDLMAVAVDPQNILIPVQIQGGYQYSGFGNLTGNALNLTLAQNYGGVTFYDTFKGKKKQ